MTRLFIRHPEARWQSAVIYSLLIGARRAGLDPAKWLEDVLRRIPTATTASLHELLPGNWKPTTAYQCQRGIIALDPAILP